MFGRNNDSAYSKLNLDDFSDDSSSGGQDFVRNSLQNQQVRKDNLSQSNTVSKLYTNHLFVDSFTSISFNLQELMKKQDEGLDMLSESVARLGEMSMGISEELSHQGKMLDNMETDIDLAGEELDLVTRKTNELIRSAGGKKNCMVIVSLSIIAILLLFLILYT
jgi:hypothetical protein